jgi:DNA-binding transcriptional ArsR family regulator
MIIRQFMKAAYIVDDPKVAYVLVDPMRRAILSFLRQKPMTQAQLADELGLSDASLNYHMKKLKGAGLVVISRRVAEEHGIIQKFFSPVAFLFVYDLDALPKDISRYFYPISVERALGMISALEVNGSLVGGDGGNGKASSAAGRLNIGAVTEDLSRLLVSIARRYEKRDAQHGDEGVAYEIYAKAVKAWRLEYLQKEAGGEGATAASSAQPVKAKAGSKARR